MGLQLTGKWFWSLISDAEVTFFVVGLDWSHMRLYLEKSSLELVFGATSQHTGSLWTGRRKHWNYTTSSTAQHVTAALGVVL